MLLLQFQRDSIISQRQAIIDASTIAGLDIIRIISEPAAAAISFSFDKRFDEMERNILVFDLGSRFLNVSVVDIGGGLIEVKSLAEDSHLGGEYFDLRMVNYFADRFQKKFKCDPRQSPHALMELKKAFEQAKRTLSTATTASIICDSLYEGHDFMDNNTRAMFENLNDELFRTILNPVAQAL